MAITNIEVLKTRLAEAEEAYHKLMIGEKEVSVSVGNFGSPHTTKPHERLWKVISQV